MTSRYAEIYESWRRDPQGFWADAAAEIDWLKPWDKVFDPSPRRLRPLVRRARSATPASTASTGTRRSGPTRPRSSTTARSPARSGASATASCSRSAGARRRAAGPRRRKGRPRHHLHADDPGGGDRDARLRAARRGPFRRVRRLRRAGARHPHRRRHAEAHHLRLLRHRARPHRRLQAAARRGDRARDAQAGRLPHPAARGGALRADRRPRPRSRRGDGEGARPQRRMRAAQGHRPALHPLHLRHDRPAEGRRARQWRPHGRAQMVDAGDLRHRSRRDVLGRLRRRLGGRPFLHRLRAAAARLHDRALRGQAGRHARRRRLLARHLRAQRGGALHRADRLPRHPKDDPDGHLIRKVRSLEIPHAVPRRRARRPGHDPMGRASSRRPRHRPLVADGDRLVDLRQPGRARACCR